MSSQNSLRLDPREDRRRRSPRISRRVRSTSRGSAHGVSGLAVFDFLAGRIRAVGSREQAIDVGLPEYPGYPPASYSIETGNVELERKFNGWTADLNHVYNYTMPAPKSPIQELSPLFALSSAAEAAAATGMGISAIRALSDALVKDQRGYRLNEIWARPMQDVVHDDGSYITAIRFQLPSYLAHGAPWWESGVFMPPSESTSDTRGAAHVVCQHPSETSALASSESIKVTSHYTDYDYQPIVQAIRDGKKEEKDLFSAVVEVGGTDTARGVMVPVEVFIDSETHLLTAPTTVPQADETMCDNGQPDYAKGKVWWTFATRLADEHGMPDPVVMHDLENGTSRTHSVVTRWTAA